MRPQHPKARDLGREECELLSEGGEERAGAAIAREERRCVLTPHRVAWVVRKRVREETTMDIEQRCEAGLDYRCAKRE